jgi:hypothetical protein
MSGGGGHAHPPSSLAPGGVATSSKDWSSHTKLSRLFKNEQQVGITKKIKTLLTFYSQWMRARVHSAGTRDHAAEHSGTVVLTLTSLILCSMLSAQTNHLVRRVCNSIATATRSYIV